MPDPSTVPVHRRRLCRLLLLLSLGCAVSPEQAATQAIPSLSIDPLAQARSLLAAGKFHDAELQLRALITSHPDAPEPRFLLGETLFREARAVDSLTVYTEAAKLRPPTADELVVVASDYVVLNDFADARRWLTLATEKSPDNVKAWYLLGRADYNLDRSDDARLAFLTCLRIDPNNVRAQYNLGLVYERLRQPELAITAYRRAISLQEPASRRDSQPYLDLGMLLLSQDHAAEALPLLRAAVDLAGSNPLAHQQLALCLEKLAQYQEAAVQMELCAHLAPQAEGPPFFLGRIYHRLGRDADARQQFARAQQLAGTKSAAEVPNLEPANP